MNQNNSECSEGRSDLPRTTIIHSISENPEINSSNQNFWEDCSIKNEEVGNNSYFCKDSYQTRKDRSSSKNANDNEDLSRSISYGPITHINECSDVKKQNITNSTDNGISQFLEKSERIVESPSPVKKQPKIAFFDVTKLKTPVVQKEQREEIERLQTENKTLKQQMEQIHSKYLNLLSRMKEREEDNSKLSSTVKKLDDQLKTQNKNYCLVQKKVTNIEKDNRDLVESLKTSEIEKKSLSDKWQKLSKKIRTEDNYKANYKLLEDELSTKNKMIEESTEKFYLLKAELQITKENEKTYKRLFEEPAQAVKYLNEKYEADAREKDFLLTNNLDLLARLGKAQSGINSNSIVPSINESDLFLHQNTRIQELEATIQRLKNQRIDVPKQLSGCPSQFESVPKREQVKCKGDSPTNLGDQEANTNEKLACSNNFIKSEVKEEIHADTIEPLKDSRGSRGLISSSEFKIQDLEQVQSMYALAVDNIEQSSRYCSICSVAKDEGFKSFREDNNHKLTKEEQEIAINYIEKHNNLIKTSIVLNEETDRYDRLLLNHYKALERIKKLEKGIINMNQRQDTEFSNPAILSVRTNAVSEFEVDHQADNNELINNSIPQGNLPLSRNAEDLQQAADSTAQGTINTLLEKHQLSTTLLRLDREEVIDVGHGRSKGLEKFRISRDILKTEENESRSKLDCRNYESNKFYRQSEKLSSDSLNRSGSCAKLDSRRSRSNSRERSYHEIYMQKKSYNQPDSRNEIAKQINETHKY